MTYVVARFCDAPPESESPLFPRTPNPPSSDDEPPTPGFGILVGILVNVKRWG